MCIQADIYIYIYIFDLSNHHLLIKPQAIMLILSKFQQICQCIYISLPIYLFVIVVYQRIIKAQFLIPLKLCIFIRKNLIWNKLKINKFKTVKYFGTFFQMLVPTSY